MTNRNKIHEAGFDFDFVDLATPQNSQPQNSPAMTPQQQESTYLTGAEINERFGDDFSNALNDYTKLTETAVLAHNKASQNEKVRKIPRYIGNVTYWALTASVFALPFISDTDIQQFGALKGAFELKALASGALDGLSGNLDNLFSVVKDNAAGFAKFAGWQFAIGQIKGSWNNFWDQHLGALSSGQIKMLGSESVDTAAVMAAYNRLGVSFYCSDNSIRERADVIKEIDSLSNRVSTLSDVNVAHFMRATGVLPHDEYSSFLSNKIASKVQANEYTKYDAEVAKVIMPQAEHLAHAIHAMYRFDKDIRNDIPIVEKYKDTIVFTNDELMKIESFLKSCNVVDSGGLHNVEKKTDGQALSKATISSEIIAEHILVSTLNSQHNVMSELTDILEMCEQALSRLGMSNMVEAANPANHSKRIELFRNNDNLLLELGMAEAASLFSACEQLKGIESLGTKKTFSLG